MADSFELTIRTGEQSLTLTVSRSGEITAAPTGTPSDLVPPTRIRGFSNFDSGVDLIWAQAIETPELAAGLKLALPDHIADVEVASLVAIDGDE